MPPALSDTPAATASPRPGKTVQLAYRFGELCLFRRSFRLQTRNIDYLTTPPFDPHHPPLPPATSKHDPENGHTGIMLYSHPARRGMPRLFSAGAHLGYVVKAYARFFVRIDGSYEDYFNKFSGKTRSTFRRKRRKFEQVSGGKLDWRIYATPGEMEAFFPLARRLSALSYQERLLDAGLPASKEFQEHMADLAARNLVRGYILFHDGAPVSYMYCPIEQGCMIYAYLGYDPAYARHSVGTILMLLVLEDLFESREAAIFDFTEGQSEHKKLFATDSVDCANILLLRRSAGAWFWLRLHRLLDGFSDMAAAALDRLGLKDRLKKLLRRTA